MYNPSHNAPLILILFDLYIASFGVALTWPAEMEQLQSKHYGSSLIYLYRIRDRYMLIRWIFVLLSIFTCNDFSLYSNVLHSKVSRLILHVIYSTFDGISGTPVKYEINNERYHIPCIPVFNLN